MERITTHRAELDGLEAQLVEQLARFDPSGTNSPSPKESSSE
ncbi:hypothetical protein BN2537_2529 [Streptomyces venezuelae]|nr:hypothetical protein BN2537_2529 [Streptomyces venezuelae]